MFQLAMRYEPDAFDLGGDRIMGRQAAGSGFLSGLLAHGRLDRLTGVVSGKAGADAFLGRVKRERPPLAARAAHTGDVAALSAAGTYFLPEPLPAATLWPRQLVHPAAWSFCGVTHTMSSEAALDMVAGWPAAPLHPWDAIVCTSAAVKQSVEAVLEAQRVYLRDRLGASRFPAPHLPVIPLGVDCEALARTPEHIAKSRDELGISPDAVAVLFLGRLSWHAKANPAPMYMALERCARARPVVLVECGWHANDFIRDGFSEAAHALMPSVRRVVLDGRVSEARAQAWGAADIFCSLSDNVQETFGLTPIEAMAAGLPCVVSDWDGYRDTIRDGVDGFTIPTLSPPPGAGAELAAAHALGLDTYDVFLSRAQLSVAVDVSVAAAALERLCSSAGLRAQMGAAARARARVDFDWRHVVARYEALWAELARIRASVRDSAMATGWPARMDPFSVFAGYATERLEGRVRCRQTPGLREDDVLMRLSLRIARQSGDRTASVEDLAALWRSLGGGAEISTDLSQPSRAKALRGLAALIKFGLAERVREN